MKVRTFRLSEEVHRQLKLQKGGKENWNDCIKRMLEEYEKKEKERLLKEVENDRGYSFLGFIY